MLSSIDQRAASSSTGKAQLSAAARQAAQQRSKALSTTSDSHGIAFRGAALHRLYYETKFVRRGLLLYQAISAVYHKAELRTAKDALTAAMGYPSQPTAAEVTTAATTESATPASKTTQQFHVCCIGGGPGTDAAGLVHANQHLFHLPPDALQCHLLDNEGSWKRHMTTLSPLFAPDVALSFAAADVTVGMDHSHNCHAAAPALLQSNLFIFAYVCHETSAAAAANGLAFYKDLARIAPLNSVFLFLDVMYPTADRHIGEVISTMAKESAVEAESSADIHIPGAIVRLPVDDTLQRHLKSVMFVAVKLPLSAAGR